MVLSRVSQSPFTTITGPLGFGGLVLFWQLQGVQDQLAVTTQQQVELAQQVSEMGVEMRLLSEASKARIEELGRVRDDLEQLEQRLVRLESEREHERQNNR